MGRRRQQRKRRVRTHKHQWRKVGAEYSSAEGLHNVKKRCIVSGCGLEKMV